MNNCIFYVFIPLINTIVFLIVVDDCNYADIVFVILLSPFTRIYYMIITIFYLKSQKMPLFIKLFV